MKRIALALIASISAAALAGAEDAIASIDFLEGTVSITRDGSVIKGASIGDPLMDEDLIATGPGGSLTIALSKEATGMGGSIRVSQRSSFYLRVDSIKGERQTQAELIAGQIGLKVKRIAGSPGLSVTTETAVLGVRGTEFEVSVSPAGSVLVACSEGEVSCSDESGAASALPGRAVEAGEGVKLRSLAVAPADYASFRDAWLAGEAEKFRKNAPKAAKLIAARYLELAERLAALHKAISESGALRLWLGDIGKGPQARRSDAELDAQLSELGPRLAEARKILGTMERILARVDALEEIAGKDPSIGSQAIRNGFTVADFFAKFEAEKGRDAQRVAFLRHAAKLFKAKTLERQRGAATAPRKP
jgi:hypothetical protein